MDIVTMTDKGQITVPAAFRRKYGLEKGDKLAVTENQSGGFHLRKLNPEDENWHKFAFSSFTEWESEEDSVYDMLYDADGNERQPSVYGLSDTPQDTIKDD